MRVFKSFKGVVISSAIVSVLSFLIGFFISLLLDTAPGASVVVVNVIIFALFSAWGGYETIKAKAMYRRNYRRFTFSDSVLIVSWAGM